MKRFKEYVDSSIVSSEEEPPKLEKKKVLCSSCGKEVHVEVEKGKWRKKAAEKSGGALYSGKSIVCKDCIKKSIRTPGDV